METVKELVAIYQRHFPGGHNAISMSLYSGPFAQRAKSFLQHRHPNSWKSSIGYAEYARSYWRNDGLGNGWVWGTPHYYKINGESLGASFTNLSVIP